MFVYVPVIVLIHVHSTPTCACFSWPLELVLTHFKYIESVNIVFTIV